MRALPSRQQRVLELLADGLTEPEIAARMFVCPSTVRSHKALIFRKLRAKTAAQAVAEGFRRGHLLVDVIAA